MINERFQDKAEQEAIIDSTPTAVRKDWQYRGNVMHVELWTPGWTLYDNTTYQVTQAIAGTDDIDLNDTTGMVVGYQYVLTDGTHTELIEIETINTGTHIELAANLSYSYTTGATIRRSNFSIFTGHASAADGQTLFMGPLDAGNNDAVKTMIIKRSEGAGVLYVYYKNDASVTTWTSATITTARYSGTPEYEVEYAIPTRGLTQFKIVCSGTPAVVVHSMFFMDVTEFKTITSSTKYYVSPSGSDVTGQGTSLAPWRSVNTALLYLQDYWIASNVTVTIELADGLNLHSNVIDITHPCGDRIIIKGANEYSVNITALVSATIATTVDEFAYWTVVLSVGSTHNITTDSYLLVHTLPTAVSPMYGLGGLFGCHEITNVDEANGRITLTVIQSKYIDTPTPVQIPSTSAYIMKSVIETLDYNALQVDYGNKLGLLHNVVLLGGHAEKNDVGIRLMENSNIGITRTGVVRFNAAGIQARHSCTVVCVEKFGYTGAIALSGNYTGTFVKGSSFLSSYVKFIVSGSYIGHSCEASSVYIYSENGILSGIYDVGVQCLNNGFIYFEDSYGYAVCPLDQNGAGTGFTFYAGTGGFLWAQGSITDLGGVTALTSPAIDVVGNAQGYITT